MSLIREIQHSTNVYRTKHYIVKQLIDLQCDGQMISHDTFIKRNKIRDKEYERLFAERLNINGKRLPSTMYSRTYIY